MNWFNIYFVTGLTLGIFIELINIMENKTIGVGVLAYLLTLISYHITKLSRKVENVK